MSGMLLQRWRTSVISGSAADGFSRVVRRTTAGTSLRHVAYVLLAERVPLMSARRSYNVCFDSKTPAVHINASVRQLSYLYTLIIIIDAWSASCLFVYAV